MAVYKRTYTAHDGTSTPAWSRFLIPARYNFAKLTNIRFLMLFITLSLFYPVGCIIYVYLSANPAFIASMGFPPFQIDGGFFYDFCRVQGVLSFLLTAFVSPSLISWDISNGALQLYFCRPFSRLEYVLAKLSVLFPLLSVITWIPALLLFVVKSSISEWAWTTENFWLGRSVVLGLILWVLVLSLLGLALSSCVKLRIAAGALILGVFFGGAGFASAINGVMNIEKGSLIDLMEVIRTIWADLLRYDNGGELTVSSAWIALGIAAAVCVWILNRRIRSFEVIK
jgi:ABC-type transport system involved in multi-copper enzyme maturation permease subunit